MTKMTNKAISTLLFLAISSTSSAFSPVQNKRPLTVAYAATNHLPYFIDLVEPEVKAAAPKAPKKVTESKNSHKEGLFTPVVLTAKTILGEEQLNQVRGKAISLHSDVISSFVETAESPFGTAVLKTLFTIADKDASGTIEEEELKTAVSLLGFTWLQDKQVRGIIDRADKNGDGKIDMEEWTKEAPKTLRTNLVKLAKKNGADLGFLS